jgi:hypothetical protein
MHRQLSETETRGGKRRNWFVPVGVLTVVGVAVFSVVSWLGVGSACENGEDLHRGTPSGLVCEIEFGGWHRGAGDVAFLATLHTWVVLALPTLIVLIGGMLSAGQWRWRPFRIALAIAVVVILAPFAGLVVLPD